MMIQSRRGDVQAPIVVAALYQFVRLSNVERLRGPMLDLMREQKLTGTILLSEEGINGTVAGARAAVDHLLSYLERDGRFDGLVYKESFADDPPFHRTKVKLKKEIVSLGIEEIDPMHETGTYVDPRDWNSLICDPDVLLIDARNDYEYGVGTFVSAVNPEIQSFRELPAFLDGRLDGKRDGKIAMFCTGGIRCEKSTAYLRMKGFDDVFHLRGGILKYLEEISQTDSLWRGECFVFDERVTVDHGLRTGSYELCRACRMPLSIDDRRQPTFVKGVSCRYCIDKKTEGDRQRYAEREKQIILAAGQGKSHLAAVYNPPPSTSGHTSDETGEHE